MFSRYLYPTRFDTASLHAAVANGKGASPGSSPNMASTGILKKSPNQNINRQASYGDDSEDGNGSAKYRRSVTIVTLFEFHF